MVNIEIYNMGTVIRWNVSNAFGGPMIILEGQICRDTSAMNEAWK